MKMMIADQMRANSSQTSALIMRMSGARFSSATISQPSRPTQANDFCVGAQFYVRAFFNPANQISRHALSQTVRAYKDVSTTRALGQKYSRLASRIPATDDDYRVASA